MGGSRAVRIVSLLASGVLVVCMVYHGVQGLRDRYTSTLDFSPLAKLQSLFDSHHSIDFSVDTVNPDPAAMSEKTLRGGAPVTQTHWASRPFSGPVPHEKYHHSRSQEEFLHTTP